MLMEYCPWPVLLDCRSYLHHAAFQHSTGAHPAKHIVAAVPGEGCLLAVGDGPSVERRLHRCSTGA